MTPKKIVLLYATRQVSTQATQSVPRVVAYLYEALLASSFEVFLITRPGHENFTTDKKRLQIPHVGKWKQRLYKLLRLHKKVKAVDETLFYQQAIQQLNARGLHDAVMITPNTLGAAMLANAFSAQQVFFWCHNFPKQADVSLFLQALSKPLHVVVPTQALYQFIWNRLQENTLPFSLHIIPNHINAETVVANDMVQAQERFTIFHGGGTALNKGLQLLLNAVAAIGEQWKNKMELRYVGSHHREYTLNGIRVVELPRMKQPELLAEIGKADVGIMSSVWFENAPVLLQEYLQGGTIPIVSKSGGMPDLVAGYHAAVVANPNELQAWKSQIEFFAAMPAAERMNMRKQNQQRFAAQYAGYNETVTQQWQAALASIVIENS